MKKLAVKVIKIHPFEAYKLYFSPYIVNTHIYNITCH